MKCYFLRHGIAEENSASGRDFDRALTREGVARMEREAKTLAAMDLAPEVIVTSPLLRAKQTARIVGAALQMQDRVIEDARAGPGFDAQKVAELIADHNAADAILFVGHEPGMSITIGTLVGGMNIDFKKGSLACVNIPNQRALHGSLVWLLPAKVLPL